jgi:hypothetical protein
MRTTGVLETLARTDLEALLDDVRTHYQAGRLEALSDRDPEWRAALERAEQEVGGLYEALRQADTTLTHWRRAVTELRRLWDRLDAAAPESLSEVA